MAVANQVAHHFLVDEKANVDFTFTVAGFSFSGAGQNAGIAFSHLRDWDERKGAQNGAEAIANRAMQKFFMLPTAQVYSLVPPAVHELGNSTGFDIEMEDHGNLGHAGLIQARNMLLGLAARDPMFQAVYPNSLDDTPQLHIDIDQAKADALGISIADANATLSTAWGGAFVNNFIDRARVKRVYMRRRRAVPHGAAGSGPLVCAHRHRHHGAFLLLRHARNGHVGPPPSRAITAFPPSRFRACRRPASVPAPR